MSGAEILGFLLWIILSNVAIRIYEWYIYPAIKTANMTEYEKNIWLNNYEESMEDEGE